jgi:hypothetical protein
MKKNNENKDLIEKHFFLKQISDEKIAHISSLLEYKFEINNFPVISDGNSYEIYVSNNEGKPTCFQSYVMEELAVLNVSEEVERLKKEFRNWYEL